MKQFVTCGPANVMINNENILHSLLAMKPVKEPEAYSCTLKNNKLVGTNRLQEFFKKTFCSAFAFDSWKDSSRESSLT